MSVINANAETFENTISSSEKKVLVDFWAPWCMPCLMQAPVIDEVAAEETEFLFAKVNVDENPELALKFEISQIPTLVIMKKGEVIARESGVHSKEKIKELLNM